MPTLTETLQNAPVLTQKKTGADQAVSVTRNQDGQLIVHAWTSYEKILFRIAFIFFIAISIPNNPDWYSQVFNTDWTNAHYRDLYDVARFGSGINWFGNTLFGDPLLG